MKTDKQFSSNSHQFRFNTSRKMINQLDNIAKQKGISLTKLINNQLEQLLEAQENKDGNNLRSSR